MSQPVGVEYSNDNLKKLTQLDGFTMQIILDLEKILQTSSQTSRAEVDKFEADILRLKNEVEAGKKELEQREKQIINLTTELGTYFGKRKEVLTSYINQRLSSRNSLQPIKTSLEQLTPSLGGSSDKKRKPRAKKPRSKKL